MLQQIWMALAALRGKPLKTRRVIAGLTYGATVVIILYFWVASFNKSFIGSPSVAEVAGIGAGDEAGAEKFENPKGSLEELVSPFRALSQGVASTVSDVKKFVADFKQFSLNAEPAEPAAGIKAEMSVEPTLAAATSSAATAVQDSTSKGETKKTEELKNKISGAVGTGAKAAAKTKLALTPHEPGPAAILVAVDDERRFYTDLVAKSAPPKKTASFAPKNRYAAEVTQIVERNVEEMRVTAKDVYDYFK